MLSEELKRPLGWREILLSFVGAFIGIGLSAYACLRTTGADGFIGAFILSYAVGVILHEAGHAGAAALMGGTINYVRLGIRLTDRAPWKFRFLNTDWFIYGLPFSGSVHSSLYSTNHYRTRRGVVIAAGPLANAILLAAAVVAIDCLSTSPSQQNLLMGCIIANGCLLGYSVIPRMVRSYGKSTPNDALNFWRTLRYSDEEVRTFVRHAEITRANRAEIALAEGLTLDEFLTRAEAGSPSMITLALAVEKLHAANDERYPAYALRLINRPELKNDQVAAIIDSCLTWQLHQGPPNDSSQSDELSRRLLELEDTVSTRGTRGSVLVDIGRIDEGKAILLDVLAKTKSAIDTAYSNIFLALAERQLGNLDLAREYAHSAAKADSTCPALQRVADLLDPSERRSLRLRSGQAPPAATGEATEPPPSVRLPLN
jgi:hypothetical protein